MSRYFSEEHEWVDVDGDIATVGITDFAQGQLGDIVFVELPVEGATFEKGDDAAVVESVKAASDVYSPLAGEVVAGNADLGGQPELVNQDPYGAGWLMRINTLRVGEVTAYDVEAVVMPAAMPAVLLGNSFLTRFNMRRDGDQMVLIRR